jgi:hypothetical protein
MVLEVIDRASENGVFDAAELRWMTHFNSFIPSGYNVQAGPTPRGVKRSEETRKRMSDSRKKLYAENPEAAANLKRILTERNQSQMVREATSKRNSKPEHIAARTAGIRNLMNDPERKSALLAKAEVTRLKTGSKIKMSEIAKARMQNPEVRNLTAKRVVCLDTGAEYMSINETARALGVTKVAVQRHIVGKAKTCKGLRFAFAGVAP